MYGSQSSNYGYVCVQNGTSNGRSLHQCLRDGRITISGTNTSGKDFHRVVEVAGGEIMDNALREGHGKRLEMVHHIVYGKFEVIREADGHRTIVRFGKGGMGKHGKARRWEKLFGHNGVCHSWYKRGRLVRNGWLQSYTATAAGLAKIFAHVRKRQSWPFAFSQKRVVGYFEKLDENN